MLFYSSNKKSPAVSFEQAVLCGLAPDGGLYLPQEIPKLPPSFIATLSERTFAENAFEVASRFLQSEIPPPDLEVLIKKALNFAVPLQELTPWPAPHRVFSLELFHGPTLAFKDFGARFMAAVMGYYLRNQPKKVSILVATSGDTGGAVASAFHGEPNIDVVILYPHGKVSALQEKQLTTPGDNVFALEVDGTFDDCQRLVKQAFSDYALTSHVKLASANSINIARLIPQSFYYFEVLARAPRARSDTEVIVSIPSGNFGNLSAGLIAKKMGLPITRFVAATNRNDIVPTFLKNGSYNPRPSVETLSNAMDVGNPSNFARMKEWYGLDHLAMGADIEGYSFDDQGTRAQISETLRDNGYFLDPHGAVGLLGLKAALAKVSRSSACGIFLETAHPAKFLDKIEDLAPKGFQLPEELTDIVNKPERKKRIKADYDELKHYLLSRS